MKLKDICKLPDKDIETARDTAGIIENCQQVHNNLLDEISNIDIDLSKLLDEGKIELAINFWIKRLVNNVSNEQRAMAYKNEIQFCREEIAKAIVKGDIWKR